MIRLGIHAVSCPTKHCTRVNLARCVDGRTHENGQQLLSIPLAYLLHRQISSVDVGRGPQTILVLKTQDQHMLLRLI